MALGWGRRCRDSEFLTGNRLSWRLTETEVEKTERKYHGTLCPNGEMPGSKVKQTAGVCVCTKKINLSGAYRIKQKQCTEARADVRSVFQKQRFLPWSYLFSLPILPALCWQPLALPSPMECTQLLWVKVLCCSCDTIIYAVTGGASVVNVLAWNMCFGSKSSYLM